MTNMIYDLRTLFDAQEGLMERYATKENTYFPKWPIDFTVKAEQKFVRDLILNSVDEMFEASRHLKNWKAHRSTDVIDFNRDKFVEEMVDAFKYFQETLIMCGITPLEFIRAYNNKDEKCHKRLNEGY